MEQPRIGHMTIPPLLKMVTSHVLLYHSVAATASVAKTKKMTDAGARAAMMAVFFSLRIAEIVSKITGQSGQMTKKQRPFDKAIK
jgi:hypothetical protein